MELSERGPRNGGVAVAHPVYSPSDLVTFVLVGEQNPQSKFDPETGELLWNPPPVFQGAIDLDHPGMQQ